MDAQEAKKPQKVKQDQQPEEEYWLVRFNAKSSTTEEEDVKLAVNGETLIMQRDKEVIVPQRFLECADHAVHPVFKQVPNEPRKVTHHIKTYPYHKIEKRTKEEYLKAKSEGTAKVKENIRLYGYDVAPEQLGD